MQLYLKLSLKIFLILFTMTVTSVQAQDNDDTDTDTDTDTDSEVPNNLETSEKFGWNDLNPAHWGKSLEHDAEKIGHGIAKAAKKGLKALEALAEPCTACKEGLNAGITSFVCSKSAASVMKDVERCAVKVSEEEPLLAPESEPICTALKSGVEIACSKVLKSSDDLQQFQRSVVDKTCKIAHLCH